MEVPPETDPFDLHSATARETTASSENQPEESSSIVYDCR